RARARSREERRARPIADGASYTPPVDANYIRESRSTQDEARIRCANSRRASRDERGHLPPIRAGSQSQKRGYRGSLSAWGSACGPAAAHCSGFTSTIWSSLPATKIAAYCLRPAYSPLLFLALNRRQTTYRFVVPTSWGVGSDAAASRIWVGSRR